MSKFSVIEMQRLIMTFTAPGEDALLTSIAKIRAKGRFVGPRVATGRFWKLIEKTHETSRFFWFWLSHLLAMLKSPMPKFEVYSGIKW